MIDIKIFKIHNIIPGKPTLVAGGRLLICWAKCPVAGSIPASGARGKNQDKYALLEKGGTEIITV